jgi:pyruvate-formate lyase
VGPKFPPLTSGDGPLKYEEVVQSLDAAMDWIAGLYTNTMNVRGRGGVVEIQLGQEAHDSALDAKAAPPSNLIAQRLTLEGILSLSNQSCSLAANEFGKNLKLGNGGAFWIVGLGCMKPLPPIKRQVIHFMHDKYNYERLQMALHDTHVRRLLAFGISGLSVTADSLSAIKYARVTPVRDERGIAVDFKVWRTQQAEGRDKGP